MGSTARQVRTIRHQGSVMVKASMGAFLVGGIYGRSRQNSPGAATASLPIRGSWWAVDSC
jgi:hypothetical protein